MVSLLSCTKFKVPENTSLKALHPKQRSAYFLFRTQTLLCSLEQSPSLNRFLLSSSVSWETQIPPCILCEYFSSHCSVVAFSCECLNQLFLHFLAVVVFGLPFGGATKKGRNKRKKLGVVTGAAPKEKGGGKSSSCSEVQLIQALQEVRRGCSVLRLSLSLRR
ncbi:hypothetical protein CEXT_111931 [Caerostris extrusa]|uniref:Uncharacterized protein n=1 Tax=Caerostris extrusa TaxID=172846 RepID=A0AAV4RR80_CAEEX|nr:hypothetical protein CEXT_111931 [Caerostris extrusa]